MFEWNNTYRLEIASVDAQHQTLFRIIGELYAGELAGRGKAVVAGILDRLVQCTVSHFAHEERLMGLHHYPDFPAHKAEHDALTALVQRFQAGFLAGDEVVTARFLSCLNDWLKNHIRGADMKYAPFLRMKAVA